MRASVKLPTHPSWASWPMSIKWHPTLIFYFLDSYLKFQSEISNTTDSGGWSVCIWLSCFGRKNSRNQLAFGFRDDCCFGRKLLRGEMRKQKASQWIIFADANIPKARTENFFQFLRLPVRGVSILRHRLLCLCRGGIIGREIWRSSPSPIMVAPERHVHTYWL